MGCFLGCFRSRDDRRRKALSSSDSISPEDRDSLVSKDQTAAVIFSEDSPWEQTGLLSLPVPDADSVDSDLKIEAKFLKSCGALLETPEEIQKASAKIILETPNDNGWPSNTHSWFPGVSCKKIDWDVACDQLTDNPAEPHDLSFQEIKSGCSYSEGEQILAKPVHSEDATQVAGTESGLESATSDASPPQDGSMVPSQVSNDSPYPTPLNVTDEMQTPATVYPAHRVNHRTGKHARIRTQYVYPVLKPVENLTQWKAVRAESRQLLQKADLPEPQLTNDSSDRGRAEHTSLTPVRQELELSAPPRIPSVNDRRSQDRERESKVEYAYGRSPFGVQVSKTDTPLLVESSLSHWLKPLVPENEGWEVENITKERIHSPEAARPIIGAVAASWKDDEHSRVLPNMWDGNGIPNTTTKYKEDQKVTWHGTPFEERLEKVLSDEKLFPQRKLSNGRPILFEDEGKGIDISST